MVISTIQFFFSSQFFLWHYVTISRHINQLGWSSLSWSHTGLLVMRLPSLSSSLHTKQKSGMASTSKASLGQLLLLIWWHIQREATQRLWVYAKTSGAGPAVQYDSEKMKIKSIIIIVTHTYHVYRIETKNPDLNRVLCYRAGPY